jgi:hypothetical protein
VSSGIVEYAIKPWKRKDRASCDQPQGRVLVMPGTGYTCDRPLLYWAAQMLVQSGWHVDRLNVRITKDDLSQVTPVIETAIEEWHDSVVAQAADAGLPRPLMLLIGKSLTTLAYAHACELGMPMALLTPVLNPAPFDLSSQRIAVPGETTAAHGAPKLMQASCEMPSAAPSGNAGSVYDAARKPLICAGTADPYYDADRAHALTDDVHEFPDANHSIEVPGDWRRSLGYLSGVVDAIARYAAAL